MAAISVEVIPAAASAGMGAGAMVSFVDESGLISGNTALGNLIPKLSSQRTTNLHTPYTKVRKSLDVGGWIGQTQDTAWLQT